jgi:hypothetical protein
VTDEPTPSTAPVGDVLPAAPPPWRDPSSSSSSGGRRRRWPLVVGVVALVAVVAAGGAFVLTREDAPEWDPEVRELARFVERSRGGTFEEPVEVVFRSKADYSEQFAVDRAELDEEDEEAAAQSLGTLRALGFLAGDLDLFETSETLGGSGTLGFFLPEDGRIHVRGGREELDDVAMKVTLVHELTHAYDFAHFDLDLDEDDLDTSGKAFAYRAVVEGSAELVEQEYYESLSEADQEQAYSSSEDEEDQAALEELPPIFLEAMGMPYALGPRFLLGLAGQAVASSPRHAVDQALKELPVTEEEVVDISVYYDDEGPRKVKAPALRDGEEEVDEPDDFGQVSLALLLAPHVGSEEAWAAVQGWAGDASRIYRTEDGEGPYCVRVAVAFDGGLERNAFESAAEAWAAAIPGAKVGSDEDLVVLDACDPGPSGPPVPTPEGPSVTEVVAVSSDVVRQLVLSGVPRDAAECVRGSVFDRLSMERFVELDRRLTEDPEDAEALGQVQEAFGAAAEVCGLQPGG